MCARAFSAYRHSLRCHQGPKINKECRDLCFKKTLVFCPECCSCLSFCFLVLLKLKKKLVQTAPGPPEIVNLHYQLGKIWVCLVTCEVVPDRSNNEGTLAPDVAAASHGLGSQTELKGESGLNTGIHLFASQLRIQCEQSPGRLPPHPPCQEGLFFILNHKPKQLFP